MLVKTSGIKLKLVLENVYDKLKLQTTKPIVSFPYGGEMAASQIRVKMSNNNNSQRIIVPTMQRQRVASPPSLTLGATAYWSALVRSKKPEGREAAFTKGYGKNQVNWSRIGPKIRVVWKSKPEIGPVRKRTIPFLCEQKRQVQFRSTFRTCWVSTGTRKCISLTKLVTLSQYIRESLLSCRCFFIFRNELLNFNFSEPQNFF